MVRNNGNESSGGSDSSNGIPLPTTKRGAVGDDLWQATHKSIQAGIYRIVNRSTNSQLVVWDYSTNAQAVVQAFVCDPNNPGDERTWDIGHGGPGSTDLTIMSHYKSDRFLTVGPHVSQERNTVRMIPVPQVPGSFYISPNMGNPTLVIFDPNSRGTNGWPVTMIELHDINQDIRRAQWQLVHIR
ncbi:hypothetical protein BDZ94DRAFT_617354 [Collybia nuda]|uniref:Uncharacterized protein n=1 Tax=Collybia nuda TaxID=64659 RepID=A0A9P6CB24_9AGAR|nr:hypothetical protein BDZ94DRAFT_617354 [Collybia nuda]